MPVLQRSVTESLRDRRASIMLRVLACALIGLPCIGCHRPSGQSIQKPRPKAGPTSSNATSGESTEALADQSAETPVSVARRPTIVGDDRQCAECHSEISRTYAEHPMGRSL